MMLLSNLESDEAPWTVPLILNHSYHVGKLTSLKIPDTIVSRFKGSETFISAIFEFVKFPTR